MKLTDALLETLERWIQKAVNERVTEATKKIHDEAVEEVRAVLAVRPTLSEELQLVQHKLDALAEDYKRLQADRDVLVARLALINMPADLVWFWQGEGDRPESLSCPVVMDAETLRVMLAKISAHTRCSYDGDHDSKCDCWKTGFDRGFDSGRNGTGG